MPEITKITQQKRNKEYYNIYLDGNFAFGIHEELVIQHCITKGKQLDPVEMKEILVEDNKKRAFNTALHYLAYRRRTQFEIEKYLRTKEYPEETIEEAINKLKYYNMIDDKGYMKAFISDKKLGNPVGRKKLIYDLQRRGVSEEDLNQLDQYFSQEDEYQQAKKLVEKYNKKYSKLLKRERSYKISQAGQRRGFSWEIIKAAMDDVLSSIEEEEDNQHFPVVDKEKVLQWANKYKGRYEKKGLKDFPLKQKIAQGLRGRGYSWELIEETLREIL